jgi:hypothetical protein
MVVVGRICRFIACAILAAFVLTPIGVGAANAQQSQNQTVSDFLANPEQLLQQYPSGGSRMANLVQQFAIENPTTFKLLLGLLPSANDLQKGAIGEGLAMATKIEVLTDQALAEDWQNQIAAIHDPVFEIAATNAFGDVQIGAVGGGPLGGAGGGPGSPRSINLAPSQNLRSTAVPTQQFTYTPTTTAGPSRLFTTNGQTDPSNPVSP